MFPINFASVTAEIRMHSRHVTKMDIYYSFYHPIAGRLLQKNHDHNVEQYFDENLMTY